MFFTRKQKGDLGEQAAVHELKRMGYKILERNFRVRNGELDIIALDNDVLAIIEVKTRSNEIYGSAEEAVDSRKLNHMLNAINIYLTKKNLHEMPVRIDVVTVDLADGENIRVEVIKNAVELG